jgi:hypothetical protein
MKSPELSDFVYSLALGSLDALSDVGVAAART